MDGSASEFAGLQPIPEGMQVTIDILAAAQEDPTTKSERSKSGSIVVDEEVMRPSEATSVYSPEASAIEASGGVVKRAIEIDLETPKGSTVYSVEGTAQGVPAGVAHDLAMRVTGGEPETPSKEAPGEDG